MFVGVQGCSVGPGDDRAQLCDCRQRFKALQYLGLSEIPPKVPELIDLCMNGKPVLKSPWQPCRKTSLHFEGQGLKGHSLSIPTVSAFEHREELQEEVAVVSSAPGTEGDYRVVMVLSQVLSVLLLCVHMSSSIMGTCGGWLGREMCHRHLL